MNKTKLNQLLESAISDFTDEIRLKYPEGSNEPITCADLNELARQASYALDTFRQSILEYLD